MNYKSRFSDVPLNSDEKNLGLTDSFLTEWESKQDAENRNIAVIYEKQVPKISFDVAKAVREMRSAATGGESDSWVD